MTVNWQGKRVCADILALDGKFRDTIYVILRNLNLDPLRSEKLAFYCCVNFRCGDGCILGGNGLLKLNRVELLRLRTQLTYRLLFYLSKLTKLKIA